MNTDSILWSSIVATLVLDVNTPGVNLIFVSIRDVWLSFGVYIFKQAPQLFSLSPNEALPKRLAPVLNSTPVRGARIAPLFAYAYLASQ